MTISSTTRIAGPFLSGTALPFTFKVFAAADLEVVRLNTSTGVETTLVLNSDYTVALNGNQNTNPGGTVNLTVAASATSTVTITSDIANLQPTDLTNQGGFYPEVITDSFDRATIQIQQMAGDVSRSMKAPISDGNPDMDLPAASVRANSFLAFDANGKPTIIAASGSGAPVGSTSASLVSYDQGGSGAAIRSVQARLRECVYASDFGAVGDGVADDTAALRAAFQYAIPLNRPVVLRGTYRVTGSLETGTPTRTAGELHIVCDGSVRINVDAASTAFTYLFWLYVDPNGSNFSVTGGSLRIDCADKCANAFYLRHLAASTLGTISFECPVTILNCKQNAGSGDASGISIFGNWQRVDINDVTIIGVSRTAASGVCRGITASVGDGGECTIRRPYIKEVLFPVGGLDADGIGVAGPPGVSANLDFRAGRFVIENGTFIDCSGRAIKSQCSNTTVIAPYIYRKNHVGFTNSVDLDFQFGNGIVLSPVFEYRKNGGVSPLGASHTPVAFQNRVQTASSEMASLLRDATVVTEATMFALTALIYSSTAVSSQVVIDGITVCPAGGLATSAVTDSIVAIPTVESTIVAMPGTATVIVRNVRGPLDRYIIGYSGYSGGSIASKLAIEVSDCFNTLAVAATSVVFGNVSGSRILALDAFHYRSNQNYATFVANTGAGLQNFDFAQLPVGTAITIGLDYLGTVTNAPPWETGTTGRALIEVLATGFSFSGSKFIRVTTLTPTDNRPKVFVSYDNATSWKQLGGCTPVTKTADFTVASNEDVLINNKSGSACTVTLPAASSWNGRRIVIKTIQAQAVNSASSNVVPLAGGAAGTVIVTGTAGKYAELVSDGTNWITMSGN